MVKFAFFATRFHFRLDLADPERGPETVIAVLMTFKGTGWQVTNVKLPDVGRSLKVTQTTGSR